ncbi:hypothetical protein D4R99_05475 [bacterium]|nr:MAG: hypothetical protein D4R99_05475 [bacterium]
MFADRMRMAAAYWAATHKTYVDDVFSTYLYRGNVVGQTINNGIDLSNKGGWCGLRVGFQTLISIIFMIPHVAYNILCIPV